MKSSEPHRKCMIVRGEAPPLPLAVEGMATKGSSTEIDNRTRVEMRMMARLQRLQKGASEHEALAYQLAEDAILMALMARPGVGTTSDGADLAIHHERLRTILKRALRSLHGAPDPEAKTLNQRRQKAFLGFLRAMSRRIPADGTTVCEAIQFALSHYLPFEQRDRTWTPVEVKTAALAAEKWKAASKRKWEAVNALFRLWQLNTSDKRVGGNRTSGTVHPLAQVVHVPKLPKIGA